MYSGELGGGEFPKALESGTESAVTGDNIDYLRPSFESIQPECWDKLSLSERVDALRLLETRTAELEGREPRAVVCKSMEGDSIAEGVVIRVNADHIGKACFRDSVLRPFSFKGHPVSFRGDFESLMKDVNSVIADTRQFIKSHGKTFTSEGYIERGVQRINEDRERLKNWIEVQETRPIAALRQDLHNIEIELEKEKCYDHQREILKEQQERELASLKGQTMDQFHAEESGYKQVFPRNMYELRSGNPNLFTKDDKLYELLPSGNLYEVYSTGNLATIPTANVRR